MEKLNKDEALAKIKTKINNFYENLGRDMISDTVIEQKELIEDIDEILSRTSVSVKHLIIERLKKDEEL